MSGPICRLFVNFSPFTITGANITNLETIFGVRTLRSTLDSVSIRSSCRFQTRYLGSYHNQLDLFKNQSDSFQILGNNLFFNRASETKISHDRHSETFVSRSLTTSSEAGAMSNNDADKVNSVELLLRKKYKPCERIFGTPYGHIACLEWGQPNAPHKVLCVHGWLDNAGSFERLIPFILDHNDNHSKYHIIAMDMPGVGHSSHKPPGADYTTFSNILEMRRVTQQLGWKKLTLLSHSLGAHFSFMYSCIYPDQIESMISIDLAHPITRQVNNWNVTIANSIEDHFKCEYHHEDDPTTNIRVPVYSEVDAIKRLMDGHSSSLTRESAEVMLKRGAKKQRWGFTFNRDVRLRHLSLEMRPDDDLMLQFLKGPFRPNLFIIRANRSPYHRPEDVRMKYYELFELNCPLFRDTMLDGTHHLHMNSPGLVAKAVNEFLDLVRGKNNDSAAGATEEINRSNL